jgi:hypothetical protein
MIPNQQTDYLTSDRDEEFMKKQINILKVTKKNYSVK